ncbi:MAG TPA: signal peptidase I [Firmicutes bacterium]|nr:signal peptidase I [Bacillota bacterium]
MMDGEIWEWLKSIALAIVLALFIRFFVVEVFVVDGLSMMPTIRDDERLLVNKFIYLFQEPQRSDVIIFSFTSERDFIKRVIGTAGDEVKIENGLVYVNGLALDEDYVMDPPRKDYGPVVVPEGSFFVMGDNRNASMDSRDPTVGMITKDRIKGKALIVFWPLDSIRLISH